VGKKKKKGKEMKWKLTLEVQANDGRTETWEIAGPRSPDGANGWTKTTVKPGDVITGIRLSVLPTARRFVRLERVVLANARKYASTAARLVDRAPRSHFTD